MARDRDNVIPMLLAVLLHGAIFAAMIFAIDFSGPHRPVTPLAIQASLVAETAKAPKPAPKKPEKAEPEAEPPPQPDREAEARREAEAQKRAEEQAREQQRVREQQQAEQRRLEQEAEERRKQEAAERERQRQEAIERQKREEAEKERQRQAAERKRLEDIERQRQENERLRQQAEEAERQRLLQSELAEEEARQEAMSSGAMDRYIFAIQQKIQRNWIRPASATPGLNCVVNVRQVPGGEVIGATIVSCNGDAAVQRSIEAAVYKASPLPEPDDPSLFDRNLRITFKPEQ